MRDDLFTIVHELFETDTARYADILLPATSQREHVALHKPYGHLSLQYNTPAIAPRGEARSNWDVMRALAAGMGYSEPWLQADATEVIREILQATAHKTPLIAGITLERLQGEGSIPLNIPADRQVPFADGIFHTPSGKVEFYSAQAAARGYYPIPGWEPEVGSRPGEGSSAPAAAPLPLPCPAPHPSVSSTFATPPPFRPPLPA